MRVDSIKNGIVIDHITCGKAMQIYDMLNLDKLDCTVAILKNVPSNKMGKKDIIKIDGDITLDTDILGYVVADDLNTKLGKVAHGDLVIFNVLISGGQADLDVIVDVDRLYNIDVEAVLVALRLNFGDLGFFPDLTGHFVVQRPDDAGDTGDLLDVGKLDLVVAFTVPTETHLHWHNDSSSCVFGLCIRLLGRYFMELVYH